MNLKTSWYAVFILTLANISSFIDRQILSLLVKPIKRDLHLSDTEMSLLMGLSFAIFYTLFGMFIGRLADRKSRRNIIMVGITVWSAMTSLCAGAVSYFQFFMARMGVGVGESTLSPSAYSMIADMFPKNRLATAMSVFSMGVFLGSGLATLIGSGIVASLPTEGMVTVPILGEIFPWQLIFLYVGLPGLVIALLLFTIKEPTRKNMLQVDGNSVKLSLSESLKIIFKYKKAYLLICFTIAFQALINYGCNAWVPTFVARTYGWEVPRAGAFYGAVVVISSVLGVMFGGWYADKLTKEGKTDGRLRVGVLSGFLALISCFIPLLPKAELVLIAISVPVFALSAPFGAATAALQEIMPNQVRALASSILLFIINLIGIGLGPTSVALFTDFVFKDENMIRYSLVLLYIIGGGLAFLLSYLSLKPYRNAIEDMKQNTISL
ncbi:Hexuronate transporter [Emticicia aquatica]|jgi:MFS family permease|uniref:Hexuronate transporter n=1 Tax=Emticicia aquatica TaxID=1681835 RepID=A0ABN8ENF5_9BACT|nr:MFS transporter [Emticicia aquatica]CAH0994382.1 Hexuronate transporter [Emticicia aquatica]